MVNWWLLLTTLLGIPTLEAKEKCYDVAGCFEVRKLWFQVPHPTDQVMTFAYYYDRNHRDGIKFNIYPDLSEAEKLPFDKKRNTYVIFHGHTDNAKLPWITALKDAILSKADGQIITPDYGIGAKTSFMRTCSNLPLVGRLTRVLLDKLGTDTQKLHVIGHSCGGQAASFVCKEYTTNGKQKVKHLTVLDSPVILIAGFDPNTDIKKQDADFVDSYHTHNGREAVGHIDVYFNGGIVQPPCKKSLHNVSSTESCYHHMSHDFYVSSVKNATCFKPFPAKLNTLATLVPFKVKLSDKLPLVSDVRNCGDDCLKLGLEIDPKARGVFMAVTSADEPYCTPDSAFSKY